MIYEMSCFVLCRRTDYKVSKTVNEVQNKVIVRFGIIFQGSMSRNNGQLFTIWINMYIKPVNGYIIYIFRLDYRRKGASDSI